MLAAQHLFGLPERGHLSPTNLGRLASEVSDFAAQHVRGAEDLVQQLDKLTHRLGAPDTGARVALARRQEDLLRTLDRTKDRPGELVTALAAAQEGEGRYLGATQQEASLSITTAPDVASIVNDLTIKFDK